MNLKNNEISKFIDSTATQLLHYLIPKKYAKEGSLANKSWMKKVSIVSPLTALIVLSLIFVFIKNNPMGGMLFALGLVFLFMVLGCFTLIGILSLFKRDASILYLYLLKISAWAFAGFLIFGVLGKLPSSNKSQNTNLPAKIETQKIQSDHKNHESSSPISKTNKEYKLIEEYRKIIEEKDKKIQALESALEQQKAHHQ